MNARSNPKGLFGLWRRRPNDPVSEPADVGTAFGMELSLMPDNDATAPRNGTQPTRASWLRRLTRRHGN